MKKHKLGKVIYSNENSAKVKIENEKQCLGLINYLGNKNKIITTSNYLGVKPGQYVTLKINNVITFKLFYILYIQPIVFSLIGYLIGMHLSIVINHPSVLYEVTFSCIGCTIAFIYKDYYKEKNKNYINSKYEIIKIL